MSPKHENYCCNDAIRELRRLFAGLQDISAMPGAAVLTDGEATRFVTLCEACSKGKPGGCKGWVLEIPRARPLTLGDFTYRGRRVQLRIEAHCSFERARAESAERWRSAPVARADLAVMIYDADMTLDSGLLERHHFDLANLSQEGPVWHLQMGGKPPGEVKFDSGWLDVPRWAVLPVNISLLIDALVFNFNYSGWCQLHLDPAWTLMIKRAEDLMVTSFTAFLSNHMNLRATDRQYCLSQVLDNRCTDLRHRWNPRP